MPASKRRIADARAAAAARAQNAEPEPEPVVVEPEPEKPEKPAKPVRAPRQRYVETDPKYIPWPRAALMALLTAVFLLQAIIGLGQHFIFHRNRLIWIDLFFPNAILLLVGTVVVAPVLKRLLKLPRHLRWLESLSLGAMYALIVTLLTLTLIHSPSYPANIKNPSADDLMNALDNSDVPGLIIAGTFGIVFAAQVFPGLSRLINAPGRKAKERLEQRTGGARASSARKASETSAKKPARAPRTSASKGAPRIRRS